MKQDLKIILLWLLWLVGVGFATWLLGGCATHKSYEHVVRDTVVVERIDSVIVTMRDVDVSLPVPQIHLEAWKPIDSISVLDNGLYVSTVEVIGGQIHHTLKPVEGATVDTTVQVADTTHISHSNTTATHVEKEKQTVERQESWWQKVRRRVGSWTLAAVGAALVLLALTLFYRRKIWPP